MSFRIRLGCAGAVFFAMLALYWYFPRYAEREQDRARAIEQEREPAPGGADPTSPAEARDRLDRLAYTDPPAAILEARRLIAGDGGTPLEPVGKAVLPKALAELGRRALAAKSYEEAEQAIGELASVEPEAPRLRELRRSFDLALGERLWQAASRAEWSSAGALAKKAIATPAGLSGRADEALRLLADHHAAEFERLEAVHHADANAHLEIAAALSLRHGASKLSEVVQGWGPRKVKERAEFFVAADKPVVVVALYEHALAGLTPVNRPGPARDAEQARTELEDLLGAARMKLLSRLGREGHEWVSARSGLDVASQARQHASFRWSAAQRLEQAGLASSWKDQLREATQAKVQLRMGEARARAAAGDGLGAISLLEDIRKDQGRELVELKLDEPEWRGWDELPDELRKQVDAQRLNDASTRRRVLAQAVGDGRWRPDFPELQRLSTLQRELRVELGLTWIAEARREERERGQDLLRVALRGEPEVATSQKVAAALQEKLRASGRDLKFDVLLDLTAFYAAEFDAPRPGEAFRADLKGLLVKSAEHYQLNAPIERLLLLTLLADLFPDEPEGQQARREALDHAFEILERAHPQAAQVPLPFPSGLDQRSVNAIDNATRYHLLVFFDGPEKFFVRLPPVRRGTIVLRDGRYKTAAVVTAQQVIPARSEREWKSTFADSKFKIVHEGGTSPAWEEAEQVGGVYGLLRAPPGESYDVDAKTGVARPIGAR